MVTRPAIPPYSSTTTAIWVLAPCISRSSSATFLNSGTNMSSRMTSATLGAGPSGSARRRPITSRACATPTVSSMVSRYTGTRVKPCSSMRSSTVFRSASASTQIMSGRGTMTSRTTVSPNSKIELIIWRSCVSMTSSDSATSSIDMISSSEATGPRGRPWPGRINRKTRLMAISSVTSGRSAVPSPHRPGREQHHLVGPLQHPGPGGDLGELEEDEGHHGDDDHPCGGDPGAEGDVGDEDGRGHPCEQHRQQRTRQVEPGVGGEGHEQRPPLRAELLEVACPGVREPADGVDPYRRDEGESGRRHCRDELPGRAAHDARAPERPQAASSRLRIARAASSVSWS